MGAGRYRSDRRSGAMHAGRSTVRELFYGADQANLYLRLDFEGSPDLSKIELRTQQRKISVLGNPAVQVAQRKVLEARIPLELLDASKSRPVSFQVALTNSSLFADVIPPDGWIDLLNSEP
jgi:hypothetical protein